MRRHSPAPAFDQSLLQTANQEAARLAIAAIYNEQCTKVYGRPAHPNSIESFTTAILQRDARALKHLSNGLNAGGKAAFSIITGIDLPTQQGKTWEAIRAWGGISEAQDLLHHARHRVEVERKSLARHINNLDQVVEMINHHLDAGRTRIAKANRQTWLVDETNNGINLSQRGTHLSKTLPLIEAMIAERLAVVAVAAQSPSEQPVDAIDELETAAPSDIDFRM